MIEKTTLTITICKKTCEKLKRLIPEGKISSYISKLTEENVKKLEQEVATEYQKANQDQELKNQLEKWSIFKTKQSELKQIKNGKKK